MALDRQQLQTWLGNAWEVREEIVKESDWRRRAWRAEYLCQRARLFRSHVHDAPQGDGTRVVFFAVEK